MTSHRFFPRMHRNVSVFMRAALPTVSFTCAVAAAQPLVLDNFETAGISGFADQWDTSFPHARTADAVHRSVLLRFPGSAAAVAERLAQGAVIARADVVFEYGEYEIVPARYQARHTYRAQWENKPPRWHYVAWPLRRPWAIADDVPAPTFNAFIDGAGYWQRYGARDETADRYPTRLGPTEVSQESPVGRMDVTALLTDDAYGETAGQRLRAFEEQGLILRKWETYDVRYADWSAYEWAVATGGHGLTFESARLEIQFADGTAQTVALPPSRDLADLAENLQQTGGGGRPTAVMPDAETIREMAENVAFRQPDWMPDWQWQRVQELRRLGGGSAYADAFESGDEAQYRRQIDAILAVLPRYWLGWGVQEQLLVWHQYREAMPEYVRDHMKSYWEAWLYPDLPNEQITVDPQGDAKFAWYEETQDWRGLFSFFRKRWTQGVGTMNFNHTACMGALLGGEMIDSEHAVRDGRTGLERMLLRFWTYLDGTSQEMLDDYYFSITFSAQKMFSDYAPAHLDRLMGEMIRDRAVELIASQYHPHTRRIVGTGGRVRMSNVLGYEQEGIYGVLHTLSPAGVLFHTDQPLNAKQRGMHLFGYDFPPGRVALQTRAAPWSPEWASHMVDAKPLPYSVTAANTIRGHFRNPPLWQRAYLGHHFTLASQDIGGGTAPITAQWHGGAAVATDADQLGTMTLRYNINTPHIAQTGGGYLPSHGDLAIFQHENRAIVTSKPLHDRERILNVAGDRGVRALYTTLALWKFAENHGWQLYVDGAAVDLAALPLTLRSGQVITMRDGHAYLGIVALPATDLGRDAEVVIEPGIPEPLGDRHRDVDVAPVLMINAYNLRQDQPVADQGDHWQRITQEAHGGFVIEMGDARSHGDFAAFQQHMAAARLTTEWKTEDRILHIRYESGGDLMEMGFGVDTLKPDPPHYPQAPGTQSDAIPYRRINGADAFLPDGIDRDTTLTQQGATGRLEKNGAVLDMEAGRKGYLKTEPESGTFIGYNPVPDLSDWALKVPGDVEVTADGKLGLARIAIRPAEGKLWIDQAYTDDQKNRPDIARRVLVFGLPAAPRVTRNGRPLPEPPAQIEVDGRVAFAVPLE